MTNTPIVKDLEEFFSICDGMHDDFETIQENEHGGKHDCTDYEYLVKHVPTGKHYLLWDSRSYRDGSQAEYIHDFPLTLDEIELIPVTTYKYKIIKSLT